MTKNKKIGISLIIFPFFLIISAILGYAVAKSLAVGQITPQSSGLATASSAYTSFKIMGAIFGLLGIVGVFSMFVSIPFGIYFLNKKSGVDAENEIAELQKNEK